MSAGSPSYSPARPSLSRMRQMSSRTPRAPLNVRELVVCNFVATRSSGYEIAFAAALPRAPEQA